MSMSEIKTQFFAQMKERICKTTSSSTSSPLNSSMEPSSGSEKENSEEELEAPKTCPQVTNATTNTNKNQKRDEEMNIDTRVILLSSVMIKTKYLAFCLFNQRQQCVVSTSACAAKECPLAFMLCCFSCSSCIIIISLQRRRNTQPWLLERTLEPCFGDKISSAEALSLNLR